MEWIIYTFSNKSSSKIVRYLKYAPETPPIFINSIPGAATVPGKKLNMADPVGLFGFVDITIYY